MAMGGHITDGLRLGIDGSGKPRWRAAHGPGRDRSRRAGPRRAWPPARPKLAFNLAQPCLPPRQHPCLARPVPALPARLPMPLPLRRRLQSGRSMSMPRRA
jgi:hypothetical protein